MAKLHTQNVTTVPQWGTLFLESKQNTLYT